MCRSAYTLRFPEDRRISVEQARLLYRQLPLVIVGGLVVYTIMASWLYYRSPTPVYPALFVTMALLSLVRIHSHLQYTTQGTDADNVRARLTLLTGYAALSGLLWGVLGYLGIDAADLEHTLVLTIGLTGVIAAATASLSHVPRVHLAFVLPATLPLTVRFFMFETPQSTWIGLLLLVYLGLNYLFSCGMRATSLQAIRMRFRNDELLERLVTENQRTETALREARQASGAKSTFLAAASHDLRQPLQSLRLLSETLALQAADLRCEQLASAIDDSVTTLEELFETLLDISRLDAGAIEVNPRAFPLHRLLERIDNDYRQVADEKGLYLHLPMSHELAQTDPILLERMVRNIIGNALQYTDKGGVSVTIDASGDSLQLSIRDTGRGIAPADQDRVFDEFVQLDNPERDRARGQGLGLAIVARLSQLLDIPLTLQSAPGRGTTVVLRIPRAATGSTIARTVRARHRYASLDGLSVAVIEDVAHAREALNGLLNAWGCQVTGADSTGAVLTALTAEDVEPDVIIADYQLHDETGLQAIRRIRERYGRSIPALIVSGDVSLGRQVDARDGDIPVLQKPCDPGKLNDYLRLMHQATGSLSTGSASTGR